MAYGGDIVIANADGTARKVISDVSPGTDPTNNYAPDWSPDGTRIAWVGNPNGPGSQIIVANADGTARQVISDVSPGTDPTGNFGPDWSPDSTQIAWSGADGATLQIYVANADGTARHVISDVSPGTDPVSNYDPQWSPDGTRIAWYTELGGSGQIYVAKADGTARVEASTVSPGTDPIANYAPDWSPDSTRVAWLGFAFAGDPGQVYVANADGTARSSITGVSPGTNPGANRAPKWSPDGTRIAWGGYDGANQQLYVANPDGTNREVLGDRLGGAVLWSPVANPVQPPPFVPVSHRVLDTRSTPGELTPGEQFDVQVGGVGGVPASGVDSVIVNLTSTGATVPGFVALWEAGKPWPGTSSLNIDPGTDTPNLAIVKLSPGGKVTVRSSGGSGDLIIDVVAYIPTT